MKSALSIAFFSLILNMYGQDTSVVFKENYDKAIEHYNKAVDIINSVEDYQSISAKNDSVMTMAREEFSNSLPFLLNAYAINAKNEKVLIALRGVYYALNDFENADRYKKELDKLKK